MPRYRYVGELPAHIPDAGVEVRPGDEFDSLVELNSASLVPVENSKKSASAPAPAPAAEEAS